MNKTLLRIYYSLTNESNRDNPFETEELNYEFDKFFDTYFGEKDIVDGSQACDELVSLTYEFQKHAFSVGFYTAIDLLMRGDR